ncbi:hypothetical protein GQR36_15010 [Enterococcus termitis]
MIKNVATGELLHNENQKGFVEHGKVPETYYSAQWKKRRLGIIPDLLTVGSQHK